MLTRQWVRRQALIGYRFAKTGDPNGGGRPRWPRYQPGVDKIINFTNTGVTVGPDPINARLDLWQKVWGQTP